MVSPSREFTIRWARIWGLSLLFGGIMPAWGVIAFRPPSEGDLLFLVALTIPALGVYAVFVLPRLESVRSLAVVTLGVVVGDAFLAMQAAERGTRDFDIEPNQIQCILLLGFGGALIAAANHLRKSRVTRRARILSGAGVILVMSFFVLPFREKMPVAAVLLTEEAWVDLSHVSMPTVVIFLYGLCGLMGAYEPKKGHEYGMTAMARLILIASPVVPIAGEMVREGGRLEFAVVVFVASQFLVLAGMFGLLATGLVEWFREPGID